MTEEISPGGEPPAEKPKYDQEFFLDLALRGKDEWNAWRGEHADVRVTLEGVDFSQTPRNQINFEGFDFGDEAKFSRCTWRGATAISHAVFFPGCAHFTSAIFGDACTFANAEFQGEANFTKAAFGDGADFTEANFRDEAKFDEAHFDGSVAFNRPRTPFVNISFAAVRFSGEANFSGRSFEKTADFTNARFYYPPNFDGVNGAGNIDFTNARIDFVPAGNWLHWTKDSRIPLRLRALRKVAEETKNHDLERDLYIKERKAERGVYLRQLLDELNEARKELQRQLEDITSQKLHVWLEWRVKRSARYAYWVELLPTIARLAVHILWIFVMGAYWALADYGRNPALPFGWLFASVYFFDWRYTEVLAPLMARAPDADKYKQALGMLSLGNAVPFVGPLTIDANIKEFLFCAGEVADKCTPIPPEGFQFWVIAQNLFSIILVFFIGLALRNYFKIKSSPKPGTSPCPTSRRSCRIFSYWRPWPANRHSPRRQRRLRRRSQRSACH
jgi:hypothetical protein